MPTNKHLVVCANGQNLLDVSRKYLSSHDLLIIGQGVFLNIEPTFVVFEPKDIRSDLQLQEIAQTQSCSHSISDWLLLSSLSTLVSLKIEQLQQTQHNLFALVNPTYSASGIYAANPPPHSILPNYFFVQEADYSSMIKSLRKYFRLISKVHRFDSPLLNFRGTIARAISVGFSYGYDSVDIVGLNPSSNLYWWSSANSNLYRNDIISLKAKELHTSLSNLRKQFSGNNKHVGEYPHMPFSEAIAIVSKLYNRAGMQVKIDSRDRLMRDALNMYSLPFWTPPLHQPNQSWPQ